jgi:hypothetical protein
VSKEATGVFGKGIASMDPGIEAIGMVYGVL